MQRVLIVEDQTDIRKLIRMTLEFENHEIYETANADEGLQAVRRLRPDLLLLDIMMPGELDGLQVLKAIRQDPRIKNTLVAMVTARGQLIDREVGKQHLANAYFVKPFRPLEVIQWLRERLT